jgi:eukaryotic-like serine/threonine-protein kinase
MATVHLARLIGSVGFARTVAIKRLHPHLAKDPDFVAMFLEEARLAARVRHSNVVATLDVVSEDNELFLVMEYVAGESLSRLIRKSREAGKKIPPRFVVSLMCNALEGLQAAHDATSERGSPLGIVHRDVSPQNIHVGLDGVARVLDFGIAKATNRVQETRSDQIKGKVQYMSPEQLAKGPIDRRADVYSAAVVMWEALTGKRLFKADDVPALVYSIINDEVHPPSSLVPDLPPGLDAIVMKGVDRDAKKRWSSAREMAVAIEKVLAPVPPREIGEWLKETAGDALSWRVELVHRIESETSMSVPPPLRDSPAGFEASSGISAAVHVGPESDSEAPRLYEDDDDDGDPDRRETLLRPDVTGATDMRARAQHRSRMGLAVLAICLLVAGGVALIFRLIQLESETGPSATPSAQHEQPAIGLGIARSSSASASAAPPASAPSAKASASAKPEVSPPSNRWTTPAPPPVPPAPSPAASNDCDNPFTVDSKGGRHPKPHCFKR